MVGAEKVGRAYQQRFKICRPYWFYVRERLGLILELILLLKLGQPAILKVLLSYLAFLTDAPNSFLFTTNPYAVYQATSIDKHHVYFNSNSVSFPNCLALGGQLEQFGLVIDTELRVTTNKSLTYNNPSFGSGRVVGVWGNQSERDEMFFKKSILDNPEVAALMEMSGKRLYSKEIGRQEPVEK